MLMIMYLLQVDDVRNRKILNSCLFSFQLNIIPLTVQLHDEYLTTKYKKHFDVTVPQVESYQL